ncbi:hypothetical protein ABT354_22425 [Streptomyces sp. NPDC000594]|uniref:hypothetical protein n=1 Tax=Streptomyces sp. NPDC000594 TaxID=3154261 RepID=UPI0033250146
MDSEEFRPTHVVPHGGASAWEAPDTSRPTAPLDALLPVRLIERRGDWGRILCANGWSAWVDARLLVAVAVPPPAAGQPAARTADPRPLLARAAGALERYREAVDDLMEGRIDGESFGQRMRGVRVGAVVDGGAMWLYEAEHERWVHADGAGMSTFAVVDPPAAGDGTPGTPPMPVAAPGTVPATGAGTGADTGTGASAGAGAGTGAGTGVSAGVGAPSGAPPTAASVPPAVPTAPAPAPAPAAPAPVPAPPPTAVAVPPPADTPRPPSGDPGGGASAPYGQGAQGGHGGDLTLPADGGPPAPPPGPTAAPTVGPDATLLVPPRPVPPRELPDDTGERRRADVEDGEQRRERGTR